MKWVTREHAEVDRVACPWLIRTFVDPAAKLRCVPREQVMATAAREGATLYDVPGADTHDTLWRQPEGAGLEAIAEGFRHLSYADCQAMVAAGKPNSAFKE